MSESETSVPSLPEALRIFFDSRLAEVLHTCLPGRIKSYNSKTRKAIVTPEIRKKYLDGEIIDFKPIENVPVMFYGAGSAAIRLPEDEVKGQTCLLLFCERSLDFWLSKGELSEPGSTRKFDLTDAIAVLALNSFNNQDSGGNNLEVVYKDAVLRIKPDNTIEMGVDAFLKLINENFKDIYNNHVHNFIAAPSGTFATSKPGQATGTLPISSVGGAPVTFDSRITNSEMTTKVKAE